MSKKIETQKLFTIFLIGALASMFILFMIYIVFAIIFTNISEFLIANLDNLGILSFIILSMLMISFIISLIVVYLTTDRLITSRALIISSLFSFLFNLVLLVVIGFFYLQIVYPETLRYVKPWEYFIIFPNILVSFSLYAFPHPFLLFLLGIFTYYLLFLIFLYIFYQEKKTKKLTYGELIGRKKGSKKKKK